MREAKGGALHAALEPFLQGRVLDETRSVGTGRAGIAGVLAEHVEDIAEVEPDSAHAQQHLGVAKRRQR